MSPVAANLRLLGQTSWGTSALQLVAAIAVICALAGARMIPGTLFAVVLFTYAAATVYRDVLQCEFARLLPGHRGMPRRLLTRIAVAGGLLVALAARDVAPLVGALGGTAASMATATLTMWHPAAPCMLFVFLRPLLAPSVSIEALGVASVVSAVVAWRLLDSRVLESWLDRGSKAPTSDDFEAQRRHADAAAARKSSTTVADLVVRWTSSRGGGADLRAIAALVVPNAGRHPAVLLSIAGALFVVIGGIVSVTNYGGGNETVLFTLSMVPALLLVRMRTPQSLPIGRRRLLRAHVCLVACGVVLCQAMLLATAGAADLAASIVPPADTMRVSWSTLWNQGPVLVLPTIVGGAAAPLQRTQSGALGYVVLMLVSVTIAMALFSTGIVATTVGTAACAALAYALLRNRYARGDLR